MDEHPAQSVRRKKRSSIVVGVKEVRSGQAAAMVSAGNSGAVLAAALFELGMVEGIERPAIASYFPTSRGYCLFLDLGAVVDPKPNHLLQWALMGRVYAERILGVRTPTIGLLSNGEEPTKGNRLVQEVYPLLAEASGLNFVGNVEGKDIPAGTVDVVVTDGFTGNVALKTAEGAAAFLTDLLRKELTATLPRKAGRRLPATRLPRDPRPPGLQRHRRRAAPGDQRDGDHRPRPLERASHRQRRRRGQEGGRGRPAGRNPRS